MARSRIHHRRAAALLWFVSLTIFPLGCDIVLGISDVEFVGDEPGPPAPWWNEEFAYRTRLLIDVPVLEEPLQDVPLLLKFDDLGTPFIANTQEGGLRVVDEQNNPLNHDMEVFDPNGESALWVRIPSMKSATPFSLYLYYGGPPTGPQPNEPDVWRSDYLAVWHLNEDATNESTLAVHNDATGHGHTGRQNYNGATPPGVGAIGGAQDFDGANDHIVVDAVNAIATGYGAMTILARVYLRQNAALEYPHIVAAGGLQTSGGYRQLYWDQSATSWVARYRAQGQDPSLVGNAGDYDQWAVVASVYNGADIRMYLDGLQVGDPVPLSGNLSPINTFIIGNNPDLEAQDGADRDFDGYLDEIRVSTVARSSDWMHIQAMSMNGELITFGTTGCLGECPPPR